MKQSVSIPYLPLQRITAMHADEIHDAVSRVIDSGWYLHGEATERFEQHYADYIGTRHCISVANGLDALTLIIRAYIEMGVLKQGDEIIVPANTFIATVLSITENGLIPVFVEPSPETLEIDDTLLHKAITNRTRAVMLVHLYGRCAYTDEIASICAERNLLLLEDNAQAHGCRFLPASSPVSFASSPVPSVSSPVPSASSASSFHSHPSVLYAAALPQPLKTGSLGHAAAHSFYPGKNLGALGDAGAVTTNDETLAATIRSLANYGGSRRYVFDYRGRNSRMDEMQAAVLDVKLRYLDADNDRRKAIAARYLAEIDNPFITIPRSERDCVWHIFPVFSPRRDELRQYLADNGVETNIHYPIPPHRQRCYQPFSHLSLPITERLSLEELSIPCHQAMTEDEIKEVIRLLNSFR